MTKTVSVYFIQNQAGQYLHYNKFTGTYDVLDDVDFRAEFMEEALAIEVAQFHNKMAVLNAADQQKFEVYKEDRNVVKVDLPVVDWLKDHEVIVEGETETEPTVRTPQPPDSPEDVRALENNPDAEVEVEAD